MSNKISKKEATNELWRRGILSYKLDAAQKQLYKLFYESSHKVQTWLLARRNGKSYCLCILALEQCIKTPNSIVKYVAPTKNQINTIIRPLLKQILADCPEELRPDFHTRDYIYYFPNGSEIQLAGTDSGHAEKLRGGDSSLAFVDEAGSCSGLNDVVKSILLPTTLITKGKIILASTPPKESDHDFISFIEEAELRGSIIKKTIDDNPRITPEQKNELIAELGGINTSECQRELYCKIIKDENISVLPEFTLELQEQIVKEWPRPKCFDSYVAMDIGGMDFTGIVFGYYDFQADKIIIEDELAFNFQNKDNNIKKLVTLIDEKEIQLYTNKLTNETKRPYIRVSDIDYIVTNEIRGYSNGTINFLHTKKDNKDAALNNLRILLSNKKIIINPKCETLLRHLRNVKWRTLNDRTHFARSPDDGHYDLVDALVYLVRNIDFKKNPYPLGYGLNLRIGDAHFENPAAYQNSNVNIYKKIFNIKR